MNKFINFSEENNFLYPINSILNSNVTRENFEYSIKLIGNIENPIEKLEIFNQFMDFMYIKSSRGETTDDINKIFAKEETSENLANFLKTIGKNWIEIKSSIPEGQSDLLLDALTYTRNPIKFNALKDDNFKIPAEKKIELIKSLNLDDQKQYFISLEYINKNKLLSSEIAEILSSFTWDSRKLQFILENYNTVIKKLGKKQIVKIANSLKNDDKRLMFLRPNNIVAFDFTNVECSNIINSLQFDKSKIATIEMHISQNKLDFTDKGNLDLLPEQVCNIICNLEDDNNKLQYLNINKLYELFPKSSQKELRGIATKIACSLKDDKNKFKIFTPEKVKELGLANFNIALITTTLTTDKAKQKVLDMSDSDKKHPLKLNSKNFARIVSSFDSDIAKINYINSLPTNENHKSEKAKIISSLKNIETLKKYIQTPDITKYKNAILLGMFNNTDTVSSANFDIICEMAGLDPQEIHCISMPTLPINMTIGVELESVGINKEGNACTDLFKDFRKVFGSFTAKRDITLSGFEEHSGVEIISPILMNHNLENLNLVSKLMQINNLGVNESCGAHVHIGADFLDSIESWKNLCEIWFNNEDLMYQITNKQGIALREGAKEFAKSLSPKFSSALKNGSINLQNEKDLDKFVNEIKNLQYGEFGEFTHITSNHPEINPHDKDFHKYYGLNFKNINSENKNTIEFRLPNGTLDSQTLMDNIRLFSTIVGISKQLGDIEIKIQNDMPLTEKEYRLIKAKELLVKSDNNPDNRMSALMHLLFNDDIKSQKIYIERYKKFPKESLNGIKFSKFNYRELPTTYTVMHNYSERPNSDEQGNSAKIGFFDLRNAYLANTQKIPAIMQEITSDNTITPEIDI